MVQDFFSRIEQELDDEQLRAVRYVEGPSLVIAGAGSGKTRVLTYKIAYLLEQGLKPWNILALTFTNKAAREMKERIAGLVGKDLAAGLWMGTFHSVFSRILRFEADRIGFTPRFTIYDQADSRSEVKAIIREMGLDEKLYKPNMVAASISNAKNRLILPDAYCRDSMIRDSDNKAKVPLTGEIYRRYVRRLQVADAMDFDDLLLYTYLLFDRNPDVCDRYADKFDFVLVDEYQDTNYAQHCIVWKLTQHKQKVCVVGDDAQSIYSFRGANIDNILNFSQKYNKAKLFKLERNYRSTKYIVAAANSLIRHNDRQIRKEVFSDKEGGAPLQLFSAYSDLEEAEIVVNRIAKMRREERMENDDFAILYRTNAQSRTFEEALRKRGIPYRIYGGLSFYQRKEIKDVIAYCRLAVNPRDEEAFKRVVNYPARGIGQTTMNKVAAAAAESGASLWEVVSQPERFSLQIGKATAGKLQTFAELVASFMEKAEETDASSVIQDILRESGMMREFMQDTTPEGMARQENVQELLNGVQEFVARQKEEGNADETGVGHFLQEVALLSDSDKDEDDDDRRLTLMTVHSAKGLEFPVVFVVGMEENLFPNEMCGYSKRALEEERRLFYVAITRAERFCFLTCARSRYRFGKTEFSSPSRFLQDIDPQYIRINNGDEEMFGSVSGGRNNYGNGSFQVRSDSGRQRTVYSDYPVKARVSGLKPLSDVAAKAGRRMEEKALVVSSAESVAASDGGELREGMHIEHERFGLGVVRTVEGSGDNTKATVEFRNTGTKQLLLRFARFKILSDGTETYER